MKWLSEVLPFLDPYPGWVKVLISSWLLLTAVCGIALISVALRRYQTLHRTQSG